MVHVNGKKVGGNDNICKFTAYVSPYFVVSNGGAYTKHIYAASQRIASKLGNEDGFGADPRRVEQAGGKKYDDKQSETIKARFEALHIDYSDGNGKKDDEEYEPTMDSEEKENLVFFYHPDHLGSTSYVTDADGNIAQHIEYIPYGEVFVEERNSQFSTNYLFNAKEFDNETGLYYYGARYLDPTGAMWLSVDPMWENRPGISPFNYCLSNPIKMIDPDGMWEQDADGNWIAQKNDNAYTLAKALNVNPSDAIQMMKDQGFRFSEGDKKVFLKVGDKVTNDNDNYRKEGYFVPAIFGNEFGGCPIEKPLELVNSEFDILCAGRTLLTGGLKALFGRTAAKEGAKAGAKAGTERLLKFTGDEAVKHFEKHSAEIMKALGKKSYNLKQYINDANWIVKNGHYSEELRGYYCFIRNSTKGESLMGFVGLKNGGANIATFHIKTAKALGLK